MERRRPCPGVSCPPGKRPGNQRLLAVATESGLAPAARTLGGQPRRAVVPLASTAEPGRPAPAHRRLPGLRPAGPRHLRLPLAQHPQRHRHPGRPRPARPHADRRPAPGSHPTGHAPGQPGPARRQRPGVRAAVGRPARPPELAGGQPRWPGCLSLPHRRLATAGALAVGSPGLGLRPLPGAVAFCRGPGRLRSGPGGRSAAAPSAGRAADAARTPAGLSRRPPEPGRHHRAPRQPAPQPAAATGQSTGPARPRGGRLLPGTR